MQSRIVQTGGFDPFLNPWKSLPKLELGKKREGEERDIPCILEPSNTTGFYTLTGKPVYGTTFISGSHPISSKNIKITMIEEIQDDKRFSGIQRIGFCVGGQLAGGGTEDQFGIITDCKSMSIKTCTPTQYTVLIPDFDNDVVLTQHQWSTLYQIKQIKIVGSTESDGTYDIYEVTDERGKPVHGGDVGDKARTRSHYPRVVAGGLELV